jgi:sugar-phosphatase
MTTNGAIPAPDQPAPGDALNPQSLTLACAGVLFDCDGVLVDSTAAGETAWTQWATEYGLDPARVLDGVHGRRSVETVTLFLPPEQREEALARIEAVEIAGAAQCTAIPGASQLLTGLTGKWAVVTSASLALVSTRLRAAGLPRPPVLITGDYVGRGKPAPDGYLEAARRLGEPPSACIVVEDSVAGIQAGHAAGARYVMGVGGKALQTSAHPVVKDLSGVGWTGEYLCIDGTSLLRPPPSPTHVRETVRMPTPEM